MHNGKAHSVSRRYEKGKGLCLEIWDGEKWVDNRGLVDVLGTGGTHDYEEASQKEALAFKKAHTKIKAEGIGKTENKSG